MIVCSCTVITDQHLENALIEILNQPEAPIPTPGVVFRHLSKKMNCCGCAPLVVTRIYELVGKLEAEGRICPYACASARIRLKRLNIWRASQAPAARRPAAHRLIRSEELTSA
jgi:hypothetical protein